MKSLKDLTQSECINIASIAEPNIEWKFIQSSDKWDGFDLIEQDYNQDVEDDDDIPTFIFQIDYRSDEELKSESRFRLYEDLNEYTPNIDAILNYLMLIGCTVP